MLTLLAQATQPSELTTAQSALQWILAAVGTFFVTTLWPAIKRSLDARAAAAVATAAAADAQAQQTGMVTNGVLVERLKKYLVGSATAILSSRMPELADKVLRGELRTAEQIKAELAVWGSDLKLTAVDYFAHQGVDLYKELGEPAINNLISRVAEATSAFPGLKTALELLKDGVAEAVATYGVTYIRAQYKNGLPIGAAGVTQVARPPAPTIKPAPRTSTEDIMFEDPNG
jgi:hypothetical protein